MANMPSWLALALSMVLLSASRADEGCTDQRASNYNANATESNPALCMIPTVRTADGTWQSMPEYCIEQGFSWSQIDQTFCYYMGQRPYPPWPRSYGKECDTTNECLQPLEIKLSNMQINVLDFVVETEQLKIDISYVMEWSDARIYGSMVSTTSDIWQPSISVDVKYVNADGTETDLQIVSKAGKEQDNTIHIVPATCTAAELDLISNGQDMGCCPEDDKECTGVMNYQSFVNCPTFDDCHMQVSRVSNIIAKIPRIDYSDFPFDSHRVFVHIYVANPYKSVDPAWWKQNNPPSPALNLTDYGYNLGGDAAVVHNTICNGSIAGSMNNLKVGGFAVGYICTPITETPLTLMLEQAETNEDYESIPTHALSDGMGGVVLDVTFTRQSTYIIRYYVFPMILIGLVTCSTMILNDDVVEQVGVRVGMGGIAILTALACSYDVTPLSASAEQLTTVDKLSIVTMVFGALVAIQSLLSYALWRNDDCDRIEPWTCWRVYVVDYFCLILFVLGYIYFILLFIFLSTNTTTAMIYGIVAGVFIILALCLTALLLKKWSNDLKVPPSFGKQPSFSKQILMKGASSCEDDLYNSIFLQNRNSLSSPDSASNVYKLNSSEGICDHYSDIHCAVGNNANGRSNRLTSSVIHNITAEDISFYDNESTASTITTSSYAI
eukprot:CFRG2460T1